LHEIEQPGHFAVPPTLHELGATTAGGFCGGAAELGIGGALPRDETNPDVANIDCEIIPTPDLIAHVPGLLYVKATQRLSARHCAAQLSKELAGVPMPRSFDMKAVLS